MKDDEKVKQEVRNKTKNRELLYKLIIRFVFKIVSYK